MKSSPHRPSIELLFKRGLGSAEIARRLQISSSTVRNVVAAIKKRGDASEVKKSGRPRSVNTRNTRAIIKKRIIRNDGLSLNRMASQLGIARSTVQSIVKNDLKLKSYKLRRGQYLSDKSKAMRLEKCRKLLQHFQKNHSKKNVNNYRIRADRGETTAARHERSDWFSRRSNKKEKSNGKLIIVGPPKWSNALR
uniref:HTH luxR-type domain-containing protein n=1 Tax=Caenorhabditis japonica TaxID=281687 RepID=A0A8R1E771_CAEJA